jgi:hypothetical protein
MFMDSMSQGVDLDEDVAGRLRTAAIPPRLQALII